MRTMKAVTIPRYGEPDVLEIRELPVPEPGAEEVLVRVMAAGLNRADVLQRRGRYPAPKGAPAEIPGLELAGEVVVPARGGGRWKEGDRVFGITAGGAQAEFAAIHWSHLAPVPGRLRWTDAAAVPEAYITAHDALVTQARFAEGERVLIHAAGSGVGVAAIQLVRALGGLSFGTSRTSAKIERCLALGMDEGVAVGEDPGVIIDSVMNWSDGKGADVVLDLVGGRYTTVSIDCMARRGRMMCIGTIAGREATIALGHVLAKRLTITGTVLRSRDVAEKGAAVAAFEEDVIPLLQGGALRPVVDVVLPVEEVREAHQLMESDATFGKIVLALASPGG